MKIITKQDLEVWLLGKGFVRVYEYDSEPRLHYKINNVMQISWYDSDPHLHYKINSVLARSESEEKFGTLEETKVYIENVLKEIELIQKFLTYLSGNPHYLVNNKITLSGHSVHFLNDEINMLVDYKCAIETCEKYL